MKLHASQQRTDKTIVDAAALLQTITDSYESSEDDYFSLLDKLVAEGTLVGHYEAIVEKFSLALESSRALYAANYADRVLHDRQMCAYISQLLLTIGFDGDDIEDGIPKAWVDRVAWPERVKAILRARERGACAQCGVNIALELDAESHIDHIVPLARGGTNDLVNLQLLCSTCNQRKHTNEIDVSSSIPEYVRRHRERSGT